MYIPNRDEFLTEPPAGIWRRLSIRAGALWRSWQNRRAVFTLLEFDDRMLRDIGLTRSDVASALSGRAADDPSQRLVTLREEKRLARRSGAAMPPSLLPPALTPPALQPPRGARCG